MSGPSRSDRLDPVGRLARRIEQGVLKPGCALQHFGPPDFRNGSNASDRQIRDASAMSAFTPIASKHGSAAKRRWWAPLIIRIHKTLRTTPAMAANVTKRLWEIGGIVDVREVFENQRAAA